MTGIVTVFIGVINYLVCSFALLILFLGKLDYIGYSLGGQAMFAVLADPRLGLLKCFSNQSF